VPKQFAPLAGKPMLAHSYAAMTSHPAMDAVLVVIGEGQEDALRAALGEVDFAIGGATRRESVANGLAALEGADRVLIHDAARPFLP
ncbi:NTP transferase domain-containing protein, partial [Escherichia coli]|nr:NTP transferase domain-containing protein [Escherichia coli]